LFSDKLSAIIDNNAVCCCHSPEQIHTPLFNIHSEEEYRLMVEINKAFDNLATSTADNNAAVYRINETRSVIVADGNFTITNDNGETLGTISISNFARSPRSGFRKIKDMLGN
jgi:hypothetical protein